MLDQTIKIVVAIVLFALMSAFGMANTAFASGDTDGIAVNPASNGAPDSSRTRFDYQLNSGQPARDSIYVYNTGSTVQRVTLYARDAYSGSKGEFLIQDEATAPVDVGNWVEFVNNKPTYLVTLKPHAFVTIPFTVNTPGNASPGDHVGAIVASATTSGKNLNIIRRVAVRLYARLSGQISPRLAVSGLKVVPAQNWLNPFASELAVSYDIKNTGNVELAADVTIAPQGGFDWPSGSAVDSRITNLLPGSSRHVHLVLKGLTVSTASGIKLIYTGVFPSNYLSAQQPKGQQVISQPTLPLAWITWIAALVGAAAAMVLWIRRKRRIGRNGKHVSND
jgi:dihydroorotate dehydrogenase (fumarate)